MNIFGRIPAAKAPDKPLLFTAIRFICYLDKETKRHGILALEECLESDEDGNCYIKLEDGELTGRPFEDYPVVEKFAAQMLRFLIDGYDSTYMIDYASYIITDSQDTHREGTILACMIITEGMVSLKNDYIYPAFRNDNPRQLMFRLTSMLGFGMSEEFLDTIKDDSFFDYLDDGNPDAEIWRRIIENKGGRQ